MPGDEDLPPGWSAHKDPDTGFTYYFHAATGESKWEKPVATSSITKPFAPPGAPTQAQQRAAAAALSAAVINVAPNTQSGTGAGGASASGTASSKLAASNRSKTEGVKAMLGFNAPARTGPIWENQAFIDIFLDGYNPHRKHGIGKGFAAEASLILAPALQAASDEWAESLNKLGQIKQEAVENLVHMLQDFNELCRCLPSKSKSEQLCLEFVHGIITRIKTLNIGGHIMVPGGWADKTEDFSLLFIVERVSTDKLTLAVCNSGPDGLGYHPIKADVLNSANMKYKMSLVFEDVPDARLCDSSFWFLVSRMHVWPGETHNAKMLYENILPGLNQRTLASTQALNTAPELPSTGWSVPPQGGDPSFVLCLLEACELVLARRGLSQEEREAWAFLVRWQICREMNVDLEKPTALAPPVRRTCLVAARSLAATVSAAAGRAHTVLLPPHLHAVLRQVNTTLPQGPLFSGSTKALVRPY